MSHHAMWSRYQNVSAPGAAILLSVIILAALILGFSLLGSNLFVAGIQTQTALHNAQAARAGAQACVEHAMVQLEQNPAYGGNEVVSVGDGSCAVRAIAPGPPWRIETHATVVVQIIRMRVEISQRAPIRITSWQEVAQF